MDRNDTSTYTVLELSSLHEDWTSWKFPARDEKAAREKFEELLYYGYEDLRLLRTTYESRTNVVLDQQIVDKSVAIYG